ncbi:MAG: SH3 domain-containing protein [Pirellulales bacterium]|nr:SH3 domain-containing protein [Pirellulales bacterium]
MARAKSLMVWGMILGGLYLAIADEESSQPSKPSSPAYSKQVSTQQSPSADSDATSANPNVANTTKPQSVINGYVKGNRVALRGGPGTNYPVLDRFNTGRQVVIQEEGAKWSRVRDVLTQRDGWIANFLLTARIPKSSPTSTRQTTQKAKSQAGLSDQQIAKRIIAASIRSYPGSCPCPYNTDRGGRRCGGRSAYSRPGGYAPICYTRDVTPRMIAAYRARN